LVRQSVAWDVAARFSSADKTPMQRSRRRMLNNILVLLSRDFEKFRNSVCFEELKP
jgi:hypothetical protein